VATQPSATCPLNLFPAPATNGYRGNDAAPIQPDGDHRDEIQNHRSCFDRTDTRGQPRRHQRQRLGSLSLGHRRRHWYCGRRAARSRGCFQRLRYTGLRNRTVLPSGHALRPLRKCAHDPGLQLLLIRLVGACPSILAPIWKTLPACPRPGGSLRSEFDD